MPEHAFSGYSYLTKLDLQRNSVTHISRDSFSGVSSLKTLYLNNNPIVDIDSDAFEHTGVSGLFVFCDV